MYLIITACIAAFPNLCQEFPATFEHIDDGLTSITCPVQGDSLAAGWGRIHRRWKVTGWRCTDTAPVPPPPPGPVPQVYKAQ